jgi:hypothetical protein
MLLVPAVVLALALAGNVARADPTHLFVSNANIVSLSEFLENYPLDQFAVVVRGEAIEWEGKSKDVVDIVYPCLFKPIPSESIKYSSILLAQFVIGSAAYQIANPSEKGKLMPQQLAGTKSMLKAYKSLIAQDPSAHIAHLDDLAVHEANGTLEGTIKPLLVPKCDK